MNGSDILLAINTGTFGSPTWTPVGSQRNVVLDETTNMIDRSNKNAGRARLIRPGRYAASLKLDALYVPTNADFILLKAAKRAGAAIQVMVQEAGVDVESATGYISAMSFAYPDMDEATISVSIDIDGEWTAAPS